MWMNTKKSSIKSIPCLDSIFTFGKVIKLEFGPRGTQTFDSASNPHFHLLPLITPMLALNFQWKLSHKRFVTLNSHPTWHVSIGYIESSVCPASNSAHSWPRLCELHLLSLNTLQ